MLIRTSHETTECRHGSVESTISIYNFDSTIPPVSKTNNIWNINYIQLLLGLPRQNKSPNRGSSLFKAFFHNLETAKEYLHFKAENKNKNSKYCTAMFMVWQHLDKPHRAPCDFINFQIKQNILSLRPFQIELTVQDPCIYANYSACTQSKITHVLLLDYFGFRLHISPSLCCQHFF